jgi:cell filamentation protein
MNKISIRFFDDREVRAVWNDENEKWCFSVLDIIGVLRNTDKINDREVFMKGVDYSYYYEQKNDITEGAVNEI